MAVYRNLASQTLAVFAFDPTVAAGTDPAKTGDAANITAQISKDGGTSAATNDVNPTELDAVDHPGVYLFDMLQAETDANLINLTAVSATSNILLDTVVVYTDPEDVRDFFDSGYDPATNQIEGVKLTDLTTDLTNQVQAASGTTFVAFDGVVEITVGAEVGTVANIIALDAVVHSYEDVANDTEFYYTRTLAPNQIASEFLWNGYVQGNGNTVIVEGYDWVQAAFSQIGSILGSNMTVINQQSFDVTADMTGTGANAGQVRFQLRSTDASLIATDRAWVGFATVIASAGYDLASVWVDTDNGTSTGTVAGTDAIVTNRSDDFANAQTVAANLGYSNIEIASGNLITLQSSLQKFKVTGFDWTLNLNGKNVSNSAFAGATVTGAAAGTNVGFFKCQLSTDLSPMDLVRSDSLKAGVADTCGLAGTLNIAAAGTFDLFNCHSAVPGNGGSAPVIDFNSTVNALLNNRDYNGGIEYQNMVASSVISMSGSGEIILNANCVGGTLVYSGTFRFVDNSGGAVTLVNSGNYNEAQMTALLASIQANTDALLLRGILKNTARSAIDILMVDIADGRTPKTGLSVTVTKSLDGAAETTTTGSIAEKANGHYSFDASAADMNGDSVTLYFRAAGAEDASILILTDT